MSDERTISVLDHGYVKFIESWGSDERIIEAARMSTNKGFTGWGVGHAFYQDSIPVCGLGRCDYTFPDGEVCGMGEGAHVAGDEKLLRYLYTNHHDTPFEMAGLIVEVQAPIFVFREWHRHRTQSYNEMSARYTPLPDVNYMPTVERLMLSGGSNKQAQGTKSLSREDAEAFQLSLSVLCREAEDRYQGALMSGVPKELARLVIPVARYSRMRASANLRNWLGFLTLRTAPNAQWEIRQYANAVASILEQLFPRTMGLWQESKP